MTQEEIDALISSGGITNDDSSSGGGSGATATVEMPEFGGFGEVESYAPNVSSNAIEGRRELLYDIEIPVSIELGRRNMLLREIFRLTRGSVIEFDRLASEPVDVLVNGKKIAEGEVVVIDKHFGLRITTLVDPADRLRSARK